jgi:hypothetical protein
VPFSPNAPKILRPAADGNPSANTIEDKVVLVNDQDEAIGIEDKTKAHLLEVLHRAFSVFVISAAGQLLLQKRA